jgi:hypothetical protein
VSDRAAQPDNYAQVDKLAVFRKVAGEATKNSHTAIKQVWAILFTGGTFALLHSFDEWVISVENIFARSPDPVGQQSWLAQHGLELSTALISFLLFVVYVLTFYRFYVGNIRVFDMKYDEVFKFIDHLYNKDNWPAEPNSSLKDADYQQLLNYSDSLSKFETFQLMINTLVIVYLTVLPLNPPKFLIVYVALLMLDLLWMWKRGKGAHHFFAEQFFAVFKDVPRNCIEEVFPQYATEEWHKNNTLCLYVLLTIMVLYVLLVAAGDPDQQLLTQILLWCGAAVAFLNCYVDLRQTWSFYNPRFGVAHKWLAAARHPVSSSKTG